METNLVTLGILLIFIGFVLLFTGSMGKGDTKVGVGGFIGPIPFGWANDPEMMKFVIAITIIAAAIYFLLFFR